VSASESTQKKSEFERDLHDESEIVSSRNNIVREKLVEKQAEGDINFKMLNFFNVI